MTTFSQLKVRRSQWQTPLTCVLALWLGSSLVLDLVVLPSLWAAGMMNQPGFASAGYLTFGVFNHCELLLAGLTMTGVLSLCHLKKWTNERQKIVIFLSVLLLTIPLAFTYFLTPEMSALGVQIDWLDPVESVPAAMNQMHAGYWLLELLKLGTVGTLLGFCDRLDIA